MGASDKEKELEEIDCVTSAKSKQEAGLVCKRFLWRVRNLFLSAQEKSSQSVERNGNQSES